MSNMDWYRQQVFENWIMDISREHPDYSVVPTRYGCMVVNDDNEIVAEYDYEHDQYAEQRVRY